MLHAAERDDIPVYAGAGKSAAGPTPARFDASVVMGSDGLNGVQLAAPDRDVNSMLGAEALVNLGKSRHGELTLIAVSPFTAVAAALAIDPDLGSRYKGVILMGGSIGTGGNLGAVAEANVGNDPDAARMVIEAFGRPGALAGDEPPRMVPLDATHVGTIGRNEIDAAADSRMAGGAALHKIWEACWKFSTLEPGDGLPVHDLLAAWCVSDPGVCRWRTMPLAVDTAGGAAWGMTVGDRRLAMIEAAPISDDEKSRLVELMSFAEARWSIALDADVERFRLGVRTWLGGQP